MTGVYERALDDEAGDLHPMVRERYDLSAADERVCVGHGEMDITRGTLVLPALYAMPRWDLLFPETGDDVPFTVTTVGVDVAGREALVTRREFDFWDRRRRFDSLTVWDDTNDRLLDFLGRGGHVVSELHPRVEDGALVVAGGRQWAHAGGRYLRLPGPFAADVEVRDRYVPDNEHYRVTATVENTLAGHILGYRGTFTQAYETGDAPAPAVRPTTLPPR